MLYQGNPAPFGMPSTIITIQRKQVPIILDTGAKKSELVLSQHATKNNMNYDNGDHKEGNNEKTLILFWGMF